MKFSLCVIGCGKSSRICVEAMAPLSKELNFYFTIRATSRANAFAVEFGGAESFGSYIETTVD